MTLQSLDTLGSSNNSQFAIALTTIHGQRGTIHQEAIANLYNDDTTRPLDHSTNTSGCCAVSNKRTHSSHSSTQNPTTLFRRHRHQYLAAIAIVLYHHSTAQSNVSELVLELVPLATHTLVRVLYVPDDSLTACHKSTSCTCTGTLLLCFHRNRDRNRNSI
jgi:hypothetical protein